MERTTINRTTGDSPDSASVNLGEGNTPLIRARRIGPGSLELFLKLESVNPTGSYKDRFAAAAVSELLRSGSKICLGTSSGNTGAALAAYAAAAGLPCVLAIVDEAPEAKLQQMAAYGATLVRISGFGTDANVTERVLGALPQLASEFHTNIQVSAYKYAPIGMRGVEGIGMEIAETLFRTLQSDSSRPTHVFVPAGGGGLALAVARGFRRAHDGGLAPPEGVSVHVVQPEGNDTIASRLRGGHATARPCVCTTRISGLQVASVIDGDETIAACRASGGTGFVVTDEAIISAQGRLAREEGVFAEPAGATALAGAHRALERGDIPDDARVVCLVTGSGFKDGSLGRESARAAQRVDGFEEFRDVVYGVAASHP